MSAFWNEYVTFTSLIGLVGCSLVLLLLAICFVWWAVASLLEMLSEIAYGKAARDYYKRMHPTPSHRQGGET